MAKAPRQLVVGERFGHLVVTGPMARIGARAAYPVRCDCGAELTVPLSRLQCGKISCGCATAERPGNRSKAIPLGARFGKLVVTGSYRMATVNGANRSVYPARCDCGGETEMTAHRLLNGTAKSCGCIRERHGESEGRLYRIWHNMLRRCGDPRSTGFRLYGARGITVCPEWRESFIAFRDWATANGYRDDLTIDRRDNDGHYQPDNCAWIPRGEQNKNRRITRRMTAYGETKTLGDWTRDPRCKVDYYVLHSRVFSLGWPPERALAE